MTSKYKITTTDLDTSGGIARLEAMGHDRVSIHKALFDKTDGISTPERTELVKKLYKRNLEDRYGKPFREF
ncbi:MAG TPA: hypothetical protein VIJ14_10340 [Rhabdochlamydiaceae bacterium]